MAAKDDKDKKRASADPEPEALLLERDDATVHPAYRTATKLLFTLANGTPIEVPVGEHFVPDSPEQAADLRDLELPEGFTWGEGDLRALGPAASWGKGAHYVWTPNNPAGVLASPGNMGVGTGNAGNAAGGGTQTAPGAPTPAATTSAATTTTTSSGSTGGSTGSTT